MQAAHSRSGTNLKHSNSQGKKGLAVESYFRDKKFSGTPEQSVNNLIRDFKICATKQMLEPLQMSLFFVTALDHPRCQFLPMHYSSRMTFEQILVIMTLHYYSKTRKLQLQSEMNSLNLSAFMTQNKVTDYSGGITEIMSYIKGSAPKFPSSFGDDAQKTRYLRRKVMRFE